jgi:hypothetical protein
MGLAEGGPFCRAEMGPPDRQLVEMILRENGTNYDKAAERLSCLRLNWGFRYKNGLTREYMINWARELGLGVGSDDQPDKDHQHESLR